MTGMRNLLRRVLGDGIDPRKTAARGVQE